MSKRVIIVHGWGFTPHDNWYPWLADELRAKGFEVLVPEMPDTLMPHIDVWVGHLASVVGELDEQTIFVGHSIGCQTIIRYLQTQNKKCAGAVFVAGWFHLDAAVIADEIEKYGQIVRDISEEWIQTPIDFEKVREICSKIHAFLSSNEPYGCVDENKMVYGEKLGAKVTILPEKGHFTTDDGVTEIPEILPLLLTL